eukprot:1894550-Rhodomonas_salina.2
MSPEPRVGHSVCMWGTEMYVFGGGDSNTVPPDATRCTRVACTRSTRFLHMQCTFRVHTLYTCTRSTLSCAHAE